MIPAPFRFPVAALSVLVASFVSSTASADAIDDQVISQFRATTMDVCFDDNNAPPDIHRFNYRDAYEGAPEQEMRLYRFYCGSGAYNANHMYVAYTEFNGIQPVAFAVPDYEVHCSRPDDFDCTQVRGITVTGMTTVPGLVNSDFDPATQTITSHSCWRGLCDASDTGIWVFKNGNFVLVTFEVDPSYDGMINPLRIVDYTSPAEVAPPPAARGKAR